MSNPLKKIKLPALQVALDLLSLDKALEIARAAWENGATILEAGTPLIKSVGMEAVRALRREFPDAVIVADMKAMDVGALEVSMAADAGADIVTVMGVADDAVIEQAVKEANRRGVLVELDLMAHPNPIDRARWAKKAGVHIVGIHIGIDTQRRLGITAEDVPQLVSDVAKAFEGIVSVAGGVRAESIPKLLSAGANIVVVGSAITRADDPGAATKRIVEMIRSFIEGSNQG